MLLMTEEMPDLNVFIEVMGCPTTCQHCWALGRPYQAMPLSEIAWVLQEMRRFCDAHDLTVDGYPMHEVDAHPQAAQVLRLFHDIWGSGFQPFTTTGVPLVMRPDWRELLETLRELNAPTLWFAFHGADAIHDHAVLREGAYRESLSAVEMTRGVGMKTGCNLFLNKENIWQFDQLVADLQHAGMQEIIPCLYSFVPHARGRRSEPLRPEWRDIEPLVEKIDAVPEMCLWRRFWHELPDQHTESWYVSRAISGTWPAEPEYRMIELVCRPNLDLYRGATGQYIRRYGNLRLDGVDKVLERALIDGKNTFNELWFTKEQLLPVEELAARFGNAQSQRIHPGESSIRHWWLDCARRTELPKKQK